MADKEKKSFFLFECTECNYKSELFSRLKDHMEGHQRNQRIKCPLCSFSSNLKPRVHRHLMISHFTLLNVGPSQPPYLQEMENVIQNLLVINEKQFKSIKRSGNYDFLNYVGDRKFGEEYSGRAAGCIYYKCTFCNYSTVSPAKANVHKNAHRKRRIADKKMFRCDLCNYSSFQKSVVIRHTNRDHEKPTESLQVKEVYTEPSEFESTDPKKNSLISVQQQQQIAGELLENRKVECFKLINQCRREIRLARLSMVKMRGKVKQQREICMEKEKRREHLLYCLKYIKITNEKLRDLSLKYNKLGILRHHIGNTNELKLQYEIQLRELQLNETKRQLFESDIDAEKLLFIESNDEGMINCLKIHIRSLKNESKVLEGEERILAKDVDLLHQSLNGVVSEVPDHMMQGLQLELEEVEREIKASLEDRMEDLFNMFVISNEDKIRNLLQLKRIIYSMYYPAN